MTSIPISEAKLNANRENAKQSTGPVTEAGKARTSRNALSHGLFATRDFVRPDEKDIYKELGETLFADLQPDGLLQHTHFVEILTATWRLRRCAALENNMCASELDPMENPETAKLQASIDRARSQAYSMLKRATAELERLQKNRQTKRSHQEAPKPAHGCPTYPTKWAASDTASGQQIARNPLCPCQSGQKYKRCCGRNAPGVVNLAA